MKLQIGIPCGKNSEKYVEHLIQNIDSTISNQIDYEFILGINESKINFNYLKKINSKKKINFFIEESTLNFLFDENTIKIIEKEIKFFDDHLNKRGSIGHGKCLNLIYKNMNSTYGMIVDSDVCFLKKNWDLVFANIIENKTIIVGAEYEGSKYKKFPNAICCFFDVRKLNEFDIDWRPVTKFNKLQHHKVNKNDEDFYGVKENSIVYKDVGFKVFYNIKKKGYNGKPLKLFRKDDKSKKFINTKGEEYQLNGTPIFTHIGRSLFRDFEKDINVMNWRKDIKKWLGYEK